MGNMFFFHFLFFSFYLVICQEHTKTNSFPELKFPKSITLINGYIVVLTSSGIYSFYPNLDYKVHSYEFKSDEIPENIQDSITNADFTQFDDINYDHKYALCVFNKFIYVLSEEGNVLFNQNIGDDINNVNYPLSLTAYEYTGSQLYFLIGYNVKYDYQTFLYYFSINLSTNTATLTKLVDYHENYIYSENISCNKMKLSYDNTIVCFSGFFNSLYYLSAFRFNLYKAKINFEQTAFENPEDFYIKYVYSSTNSDKTKALVCYITDDQLGKCLYYDVKKNILSNPLFEFNYCKNNVSRINSYFFEKSNEFIFSYIDKDSNFFLNKISENFDNFDLVYNSSKFSGCKNLSTFSIVYIPNSKAYFLMINSKCDSDQDFINVFMLGFTKEEENDMIKDTQTIMISTGETDILTKSKTNFEIIISDSTEKSEIKTSESLNFKSDISYYNIISSNIAESSNYIPGESEKLTQSEIISQNTFSEISDTNKIEPNKYTEWTSLKTNISDIVDKNEITSSELVKIISENKDSLDTIDFPTDSPCKEIGTIEKEGECICDESKGYYSINSKLAERKCYQKNEIAKNLYYNNITKSYELCYKTCGTCDKGGSSYENNCQSCATNYIREPENRTSNCVESCKYLYYYDSLNQYSCTDDEQCPDEASLIIRPKNECINVCENDNNNRYQFNGECLSSCPEGTESNIYGICQIKDINTCTSSDYELDLHNNINQDNVKLAAKNYANEFYYTLNHISKFSGVSYNMILYKNSSCVNELKLNITKIEFNSCIEQLKSDNNIDKDKDLIVAVVDIKTNDNPITSFGFFDPDSGEKLDASKSCSDKNVVMYENILNILNNPFAIKLLDEQKINIFDLENDFYNDICFHFDSPNGKDITLQDRIKTFYPNINLCDEGCISKGVNMSNMEAKCECTFHDLLNADFFSNNLFGDNLLVKETLEDIKNVINNMNIEILTCFTDVFDFKYFKKNIGGFIIISLFFSETICVGYFFFVENIKTVRYLYTLTEKYIQMKKENKSRNKTKDSNTNPPKKSKIKHKPSIISINKNDKEKEKEMNMHFSIQKLKQSIKTEFNSKRDLIKFPIENSINSSNKSLSKFKLKNNLKLSNKKLEITDNNKYSKATNNNKIDFNYILQLSEESQDYDIIIEEDKRTFCEYYVDKIKDNQKFIKSFFIKEITKPRTIKILVFILTLDLYFFINGLFYSDSYVSEVYNSKEEETIFSFVPRSIDRFFYCAFAGNVIDYVIEFFLVEEITIKKILLKERNDNSTINLRSEMMKMTKKIIKMINILIVINFIIVIFTWYYISCLNNVYPHMKYEWLISSIIIIAICQILPFIFGFLETCVRFLSIKMKSEKVFKLSLLFP